MPTTTLAGRALLLALAASLLPTAAIAANYRVMDQTIQRDGEPINLFGVNWFGAETLDHVPHGLWTRNYQAMIEQLAAAGFNAVRVPFCPATLDNVPTDSIDDAQNPDLAGLGSLEVFDRILSELDRQGLYILLDHHRPDCLAISELWYTDTYSETEWLADLRFVAERYAHLEHFVGIDLKNEPHGAATWGTGDPATDWNLAAERAAAEVLAVNPDLLVFVEGVADNPVCSSGSGHWWGGNLEPQACAPLDIPDDKLVLSPHVYGPDVFAQPYFDDPSFPANLPAIWDQHFGFLADEGHILAPGEFGGRYGVDGHPDDVAWQDTLVDYFIAKRICNFFYWSWNPNSGDTGGILQDDWTSVRVDKLENLSRLTASCQLDAPAACADGRDNDRDGFVDLLDPGCAGPQDTSEYDAPPDDEPPGDDPRPHQVTATLSTQSDWGTGYCADAQVTNPLTESIAWWTTVQIDGRVRELWNGEYTTAGDTLRIEGAQWNAELRPGATTRFGFCVERDHAPPPTPLPACADGVDNDDDALIDLADPGCEDANDDDESQPPADGELSVRLSVQSDWGSGYCADVSISNDSARHRDWVIDITVEGSVENVWNAVAEQQGQTLRLAGLDWNDVIPPGETLVSIGFCAVR